MKLSDLLKHLSSNADSYPNISSAMSRILAAKQHSGDVERCISANNLLKTSLRSSLKLTTENCYLFSHHNLPPTAVWADSAELAEKDTSRKGTNKGQVPVILQTRVCWISGELRGHRRSSSIRETAKGPTVLTFLDYLIPMNRQLKCNWHRNRPTCLVTIT